MDLILIGSHIRAQMRSKTCKHKHIHKILICELVNFYYILLNLQSYSFTHTCAAMYSFM